MSWRALMMVMDGKPTSETPQSSLPHTLRAVVCLVWDDVLPLRRGLGMHTKVSKKVLHTPSITFAHHPPAQLNDSGRRALPLLLLLLLWRHPRPTACPACTASARRAQGRVWSAYVPSAAGAAAGAEVRARRARARRAWCGDRAIHRGIGGAWRVVRLYARIFSAMYIFLAFNTTCDAIIPDNCVVQIPDAASFLSLVPRR